MVFQSRRGRCQKNMRDKFDVQQNDFIVTNSNLEFKKQKTFQSHVLRTVLYFDDKLIITNLVTSHPAEPHQLRMSPQKFQHPAAAAVHGLPEADGKGLVLVDLLC